MAMFRISLPYIVHGKKSTISVTSYTKFILKSSESAITRVDFVLFVLNAANYTILVTTQKYIMVPLLNLIKLQVAVIQRLVHKEH